VLKLEGLRKRFGKTLALDGVDLEVRRGELFVLLGPSGSGKTTLLRLIAGLERPDEGTISMGGRDWTGLPPHRRDVAMVFQHFALYPHKTVRGNIEYPLAVRRVPRPERRRRAEKIAEVLGLTGLLDRLPGELSGGEAQRVALARALVREPACFLLDEPLAHLDVQARGSSRAEIRKVQRELGVTAIHVTHDQEEAVALADRLAVLRKGRVVQVGTSEEVFRDPADVFVAGFLGRPGMNLLRARTGATAGGATLVHLLDERGSDVAALPARKPVADGRSVFLGIRPEDLRLPAGGAAEHSDSTAIPCEVVAVEGIEPDCVVHLDTPAGKLLARAAIRPQPGPSRVLIPSERIHLFDAATGRRIE
jgi:ABC-type sugar transport system ATPase subunit